jgi:[protein-PII] uridylyltransferase
MELDRAGLLADTSLRGREWCRAHSDLVDSWMAKLLQNAAGSVAAHGLALVAVGGYGRAELCPQSDIDVVLLHDDRADVAAIAERVWYPVWDAGLTLGHSVRTVRQTLALAQSDLDTATSLLSVRHLAGDTTLSSELVDRSLAQWQKGAKRWLTMLRVRVEERHEHAGEVAFLLEPDLKDGRGGLRDVHALHWAEAARRILFAVDDAELSGPYELLLEARVELQRQTGRGANQLLLQEQDPVATALGYEDADRLMAAIATAARTIAWTSDDAWRRVESSLRGPLGRIARRDRELAPGIVLRDGEVHLTADADVAGDPTIALSAGSLAAQRGTVIDRESLEQLAREAPPLPDPWPAPATAAFVDLLLAGKPAISVIEALDQRGIWTRILPEWLAVSCRPQRNAYHRFTVDRHLLETTANAAALARGASIARPDLLVVGALLHDLGKGLAGDHTERGMELARVIGARMGLPVEDVDVLTAMVEHHLLLPDVATRRDLDDPGTIEQVARAAGSELRLQLLTVLTEADSLATGASAWSDWKASLVAELSARAAHVLRGGAVADVTADEVTPEQQTLLAEGPGRIDASGQSLTLVVDDQPGVFSRVAGVLTAHGIDIVAATIHSDSRGTGLEEFRVERTFDGDVQWPAVVADLRRMLAGELDVTAAVERRARRYERRDARVAPVRNEVTFDNEVSATATVVDVHAQDGVGVLYRITEVLARHGLDIRSAKVQTMGAHVVDAFYVRDASGAKVRDDGELAAIREDVLAALASSW